MTNGDKVRGQGNLLLAAMITCSNCPPHNGYCKNQPKEKCVDCWFNWLEQEAR